MHMRTDPVVTLQELEDDLREERGEAKTVEVTLDKVQLRLGEDEPIFVVDGEEIPCSPDGVQAFGTYFGVPASYLKKVGNLWGVGRQGELLEWHRDHLEREAVAIVMNPARVISVDKAGRQTLDLVRLVDISAKALGTKEAEVTRLINTPEFFAYDVHVPAEYERGLGGDLKVGDITAGGVGVSYNRKMNHAPEVNSYLYRLLCTNGMRTEDSSLKVSARGRTAEDVYLDLAAKVDLAFSRVPELIRHFYALREIPVENPERELNVIAAEHGIPRRSLDMLTELAPTEELPDRPTRFDLLNLITNLANAPEVPNDGGRMILEGVGGKLIHDEAARCSHCRHKAGQHAS